VSRYVGDRVVYLPQGDLHRMTYTRCRIVTINSSGDEPLVARNMWRIGINKYMEENCGSSWSFTKKAEVMFKVEASPEKATFSKQNHHDT